MNEERFNRILALLSTIEYPSGCSVVVENYPGCINVEFRLKGRATTLQVDNGYFERPNWEVQFDEWMLREIHWVERKAYD